MRLIDADALKRKAQKEATTAWKMRLTAKVETVMNQFIDWLDNAPTIEPERKTGRWIYSAQGYTCSECKTQFPSEVHYLNPEYTLPKYCPECGARMEDATNG